MTVIHSEVIASLENLKCLVYGHNYQILNRRRTEVVKEIVEAFSFVDSLPPEIHPVLSETNSERHYVLCKVKPGEDDSTHYLLGIKLGRVVITYHLEKLPCCSRLGIYLALNPDHENIFSERLFGAPRFVTFVISPASSDTLHLEVDSLNPLEEKHEGVSCSIIIVRPSDPDITKYVGILVQAFSGLKKKPSPPIDVDEED